ncbi:GDP-mannose 4,6-dehydratase, partial [Halomonas sp. SIMBA_159]
AAGFIGSTLIKKLLTQGHIITGIDNLNEYYSVNLKEDRLKLLENPNFTFHKTDLENDVLISSIFAEEQPEVVINLAAQAGVR